MIKYTKCTQNPDTNFDYALSVLEQNGIGLPAIDPKEDKCVYRDENLTILLRSCGYNKALFVLRIAHNDYDDPVMLYSDEFTYEPNA